jgi:hypothetical protein
VGFPGRARTTSAERLPGKVSVAALRPRIFLYDLATEQISVIGSLPVTFRKKSPRST